MHRRDWFLLFIDGTILREGHAVEYRESHRSFQRVITGKRGDRLTGELRATTKKESASDVSNRGTNRALTMMPKATGYARLWGDGTVKLGRWRAMVRRA